MFPGVPPPRRNEVHLVQCKNGHLMSVDCWCEPNKIYWRQNMFGVQYLVVEHEDDTLRNHEFVIRERATDPDWVTRLLNGDPRLVRKEESPSDPKKEDTP